MTLQLFRHLIVLALLFQGTKLSAFPGIGSEKNEEIIELNNVKIDEEQQRLDALDGAMDRRIDFNSRLLTEKANNIYFTILDSIQECLSRRKMDAFDRAMFSQDLYQLIHRVNGRNYYQLDHYRQIMEHLKGSLLSMEEDRLPSYLYANMLHSLKTIAFFRYQEDTETFLSNACSRYPDLVLKNYSDYKDQPYARRILDEAVKTAPAIAKKYLNTNKIIHTHIRESKDSVVQLFVNLFDQFGMKEAVYPMLDEIYLNQLTNAKITALTEDHSAYFNLLVNISKRNPKLGAFSLDQKLEELSLSYVRQINDSHNEANLNLRFQPVNVLNAEALYTLMVYTKEEIFTSSFNGLYEKWKYVLGEDSGYTFIQKMGSNRFRTFVALCSGYGKLQDLLSTMSKEEQTLLMNGFAGDLENHHGDLSSAIEVADAFAVIVDPEIRESLRQTVQKEYERLSLIGHREGMVVYRLLSGILNESSTNKTLWMEDMVTKYQLSSVSHLLLPELATAHSEFVQQHFFYDDADGMTTFKSFLMQYQNDEWKIEDHNSYVTITSTKGNRVIIYANKPVWEQVGQQEIAKQMEISGIAPSILVHRGHSYYVHKTIEKVTSSVKLVILGSCGSYHQIEEVISRAPGVQIISSKQIATMAVNNPMLKLISEEIRDGRDLDWPALWLKLSDEVSRDDFAYSKFQDYIPPHQNLSAVFIKAYRTTVN